MATPETATPRAAVPRRRRFVALLAAGAAFAAITVAGVVVHTVEAVASTGTGFLHTSGSKIIDSTGATVRLTGLNWFGMETDNHTFHGLWAGRSATWTMQIDHMAQLGYNTIRVPYTGDSLRPGAQATSINSDSNPDLVGLSPMQILDKVVNYAGSKGMRIILDRHRPSAAGQTALWYTSSVSEASEIADWQMLAQHFAGNTAVIGADLFNEPHAENLEPNGTGSCWGCGDTTKDWRLAAQRIGNAVLAANSNWLIFVEGVSCDGNGGTPNTFDNVPDDPMACDWWGGNLARALQFPVQLSVANRLVYSAHDYGISVFDRQPWFKDPTFPNNLPAVWEHFWGYLVRQNIAPVLVGEFGSTLANPLDTQWLTALMAYMGQGTNGISFTYWSWNPDSGDTGGIVQDDWVTVNQNKQSIVGPYLNPPTGTGGGGTSGPPVSPSASRTTSPSPTAGGTVQCNVGYTVANSWADGFTANVTLTNTGTTTWNNWKITWTAPAGVTLTNGWTATFATSGSTWTMTAPSWATSLAPNASVSFGFQGAGPATPGPSNIACS